MRSRFSNKLAGTIAAAALTFALASCATSGDGGNPMQPVPGPVEVGWTAWKSDDFAMAAAQFKQALTSNAMDAAAHEGLAWTWLKTSELDSARASFLSAIQFGAAGASPQAGLAVTLRDLGSGDYGGAITAATAALATDPSFQFQYDTQLDWRDLRVILAQSHFALSGYVQANAQVLALGGATLDPAASDFVDALLAEIERLSVLYGS